MTDDLPRPIPIELRDAFWGSIGAYSNWWAGQPEPNVSLHGEPTPIDLICDLAAQYDDLMPDHLCQMLISFASRSEEPPAGDTFASGARFLQKQIRDKATPVSADGSDLHRKRWTQSRALFEVSPSLFHSHDAQ